MLLLLPQMVRALLSHPSPLLAAESLNKRTREGATPLHVARRMTCSQSAQKAARAEIVALLEASGGRDLCGSESDCSTDDEPL